MGARGTAAFTPLALLFAVTVLVPFARAAVAQEVGDQLLPGCGICYPGGYDINTVGEVTGTVLHLQEPAAGPVRFTLAGEREAWVVLASPAWFWKSAEPRLVSGDVVTVRGSKTLGADGSLYLVAREIRPAADAPIIVLRDLQGTPLWSGRHRGNPVAGGAGNACRSLGTGRGRNAAGRR